MLTSCFPGHSASNEGYSWPLLIFVIPSRSLSPAAVSFSTWALSTEFSMERSWLSCLSSSSASLSSFTWASSAAMSDSRLLTSFFRDCSSDFMAEYSLCETGACPCMGDWGGLHCGLMPAGTPSMAGCSACGCTISWSGMICVGRAGPVHPFALFCESLLDLCVFIPARVDRSIVAIWLLNWYSLLSLSSSMLIHSLLKLLLPGWADLLDPCGCALILSDRPTLPSVIVASGMPDVAVARDGSPEAFGVVLL